MTLIQPFAALRPTLEYVEQVIAPPYDVIDSHEAAQLAAGNPWCFLHVSKPEIDLPTTTNPYDTAVYKMGKKNFQQMLEKNILKKDSDANYYLYRLTQGSHQQTGLVCGASIQAYNQQRIRKHELTRPTKVQDRVKQIEATNAQTGPIMLACKSNNDIDSILSKADQALPEFDLEYQGVRHQLWVINDAKYITNTFEQLATLYIADGHHRTEAAHVLAEKNPLPVYQYFLAVIFPANQLQILSYNRSVSELNGLSEDDFIKQLSKNFDITKIKAKAPSKPLQFSMYLEDQWYQLNYRDTSQQLDVDLLQTTILKPILGIDDPRKDERLQFIGGSRGLDGLQQRVDQGIDKVAFALYPTQMSQLIDVSDKGGIMPPKSTWFEPKLADGLFIRMLSD